VPTRDANRIIRKKAIYRFVIHKVQKPDHFEIFFNKLEYIYRKDSVWKKTKIETNKTNPFDHGGVNRY